MSAVEWQLLIIPAPCVATWRSECFLILHPSTDRNVTDSKQTQPVLYVLLSLIIAFIVILSSIHF